MTPRAAALHRRAEFFTAVEVSAGNQLFQLVVDNDDVAARLMKELQKANAGRVTFMPLNRLRPGANPAYPDSVDGIPMMDRLEFDEKFRPAIAQVSPRMRSPCSAVTPVTPVTLVTPVAPVIFAQPIHPAQTSQPLLPPHPPHRHTRHTPLTSVRTARAAGLPQVLDREEP